MITIGYVQNIEAAVLILIKSQRKITYSRNTSFRNSRVSKYLLIKCIIIYIYFKSSIRCMIYIHAIILISVYYLALKDYLVKGAII